MSRPVYEIAGEIVRDWGTNVNYAARPYLEAMLMMNNIDGMYFNDSGKGVVSYFLNNAGAWRGDTARRIKAELRELLK